jgi:membrane associated rhomboid family serine protease
MRQIRRSSSLSLSGYFPPGVKWLIIVNTAIYVLIGLFGRPLQNDLQLLHLVPVAVVFHFTLWQLVTYLFLHASISHLVFNMLALWMFGLPLEQTWGTRRFLKYYFLCGIGAGLCDVAFHAAVGNWLTNTIGASGAIFGLLMAFGVLFPDQQVLMGFLFPIKAKYMVMIYGAIELYMALTSGDDGISSIAHLGGMAFGYVYLKGRLPSFGRLNLPDFGNAYRQWKLRRAKKKFQVYMSKHDRRGPWTN